MIADPLWSCVMLLCGPLWVFCGSFVVLCGPLWVFCGSFAVLCGSFAVFSHTPLEVIVPCISVGTGDHETYNHLLRRVQIKSRRRVFTANIVSATASEYASAKSVFLFKLIFLGGDPTPVNFLQWHFNFNMLQIRLSNSSNWQCCSLVDNFPSI